MLHYYKTSVFLVYIVSLVRFKITSCFFFQGDLMVSIKHMSQTGTKEIMKPFFFN
jgi:hypothetical protein